MKKSLITGLIVAVIVSSIGDGIASGKTKNQYQASLNLRKGYWVIQQTEKDTSRVRVLYYDNANNLIRKETRPKKNVDISRKKVMRSLKRSLAEAIEWAQPI